MSNKSKKICLNYIGNFVTLVFAVTVCVSVSAFASLVDIFTGITSFII